MKKNYKLKKTKEIIGSTNLFLTVPPISPQISGNRFLTMYIISQITKSWFVFHTSPNSFYASLYHSIN